MLRHVSRKSRLIAATFVASAMLPTVVAVAYNGIHASSGACTIAAAGDIAASGGDQQATADVVKTLNPTAVLTLGDNAYSDGSDSDYKNYYDPSWGAFKAITKPAPGNHEYQTPDASGYFNYFGVKPYYSFDVCGWHMLSLNREIDMGDQVAWIKQDIAANKGKPMLAYWHEPRWSSGSEHGSDDGAQPLWQAVTAGGVRVVLNGHEHFYERFGEMNDSGQAKAGGTREFIVGEGGTPDLYNFSDSVLDTSEQRIQGAHGVLQMTLRSDGYDWALNQVGGEIADKGSVKFTSTPAAGNSGKSTMPAPTPKPTPPPAPAPSPAPDVVTQTDSGSPTPVDDTPATADDTPATADDTSIPVDETPATADDTSSGDNSAPIETLNGDPSSIDPTADVSTTSTSTSGASGAVTADPPLQLQLVNNEAVAIWATGIAGAANVDVKVTFGTDMTSVSAPVDSFNRFAATALVPQGFTGTASVVVTAGSQQYTGSIVIGSAAPTDSTVDTGATDLTTDTPSTPDMTGTDFPTSTGVDTTGATSSGDFAGIETTIQKIQSVIIQIFKTLLQLLQSLFK